MARERKGKRGSRVNGLKNERPPKNQLGAKKNIDKRSRPKKNKIYVPPTRDAPHPSSIIANSATRRETEKKDRSSRGRGAKKEQIDKGSSRGFIFMCNGKTKPECYKYFVFGLPARKMSFVETIKPGAKLFLFDFDLKLLYGVYKATSKGEHGLEPNAFGGRFPAQVRFKIFKDCVPIPESVFRHVIEGNYEDGSKFQPQLSNRQVRKLTALFRPLGVTPHATVAPSPQHAPVRDRYREPAGLPPPVYRYHDDRVPLLVESHHIEQIGRPTINQHFPAEPHHTYLRENTHLPAQDPYDTRYRVATDLVTREELMRESEYHRSLLLEREREGERERDIVQYVHRSDDYYTHPVHASTSHALAPHYSDDYYAHPSHAPWALHAPLSLHSPTTSFSAFYDAPMSQASQAQVAREGHNRVYVDPLDGTALRRPSLAGSSYCFAGEHVMDGHSNRVYVDPRDGTTLRRPSLAGSSYSFAGAASAYR